MQNTNDPELRQRHETAEADPVKFSYAKPGAFDSGKGMVQLGKKDLVRGVVQVVKKHGGENNLHYHTTSASFWMVLKGRVRFYGPDDVVIGEFGPHEGTITPRYARYWFENVGDEDLEILQVSAFPEGARSSGRTDASPQRYQVGSSQKFNAVKA
jgi:mannose-6-phosphate isomerase-like protein (cupin superfamily)